MRFHILASVSSLVVTALAGIAAEMPTGYFRGSLVSWEGTPASGTLSAANASNEVFTCRYDSKSYIELDHWHVKVDKLQAGDPIKVLAQRKMGETTCHILSLVVEDPPKPVVMRPGHKPEPPRPAEPKAVKFTTSRRNHENTAGVVKEITAQSVTLRTRDGERIFELRPETRYLGNGLKMELSDVQVNQRLSVEAAQSPNGDWEAVQLTWGDLTVR